MFIEYRAISEPNAESFNESVNSLSSEGWQMVIKSFMANGNFGLVCLMYHTVDAER